MNEIDRDLAPADPLSHVCDPAGWYGPELIGFGGGAYAWSEDELAELVSVSKREADPAIVTPDTFPLPECTRRLQRMVAELENGVGFVIVRGPIPAATFKTAFYGIAAHFGRRTQNGSDISVFAGQFDRTEETTISLVPLVTLYNEMLKRSPEVLGALMRRTAALNPNDPLRRLLPAFSFRDGYLSVRPSLVPLLADMLPRDVRTAIEVFGKLAGELRHPIVIGPGDLLLANNHVVLCEPMEDQAVVRLGLKAPWKRPRADVTG